ncbi:MAG: transcription elongation factor GreA [Phycisphaerales bacterium]|nr:transcription elongation factor GreA [Phycisphaerales bacterium]
MELITRDEQQHIQSRLADLIANRPTMSLRIAEARALGDLKENADYHAAREDQGLQEAEIRRLEERLSRASVIENDTYKDAGVVFLGATVLLQEVGSDDEPELFRLVGEASGTACPDYVEVTLASPMGESLMKARVGEVVSVRTPRGTKKFEILKLI